MQCMIIASMLDRLCKVCSGSCKSLDHDWSVGNPTIRLPRFKLRPVLDGTQAHIVKSKAVSAIRQVCKAGQVNCKHAGPPLTERPCWPQYLGACRLAPGAAPPSCVKDLFSHSYAARGDLQQLVRSHVANRILQRHLPVRQLIVQISRCSRTALADHGSMGEHPASML